MWVDSKLSGYCQGLWWHVRCLSTGQPGRLCISSKFHLPAWVACLEDRTHDRHLSKAKCKKYLQINSEMPSQSLCKVTFFKFGPYLKRVTYYHLLDKIDKYLSLFWEAWNKQSSFYSDPSPIGLLCCLESVDRNKITIITEAYTNINITIDITIINCSISFWKVQKLIALVSHFKLINM